MDVLFLFIFMSIYNYSVLNIYKHFCIFNLSNYHQGKKTGPLKKVLFFCILQSIISDYS